jgi:hypothetical protein
MLRGYHLDSGQEIHAVRMLRSALHGFSTQEAAGGFRFDASVDDSFTWMINFLDQGLHTAATTSADAPTTTATPPAGGH